MRFFFYGTLLDPDVLSHVTGRAPEDCRLVPAVLRGFRRVYAKGASYPILVARRGAETRGAVLADVSPAEAARLSAYEGTGYVLGRRLVAVEGEGRRIAAVYEPRPGRIEASDAAWEFEEWRRLHRARFLAALRGTTRASAADRRP